MDTCPQCDYELLPEDSICRNCGAEITGAQLAHLNANALADRATGRIKPGRLTKTSGLLATYLNDQNLQSYLRPSEQPEFLYRHQSKGIRITRSDGSEKSPHDRHSGGRNYLLITNQRILYVTAGVGKDRTQEFEYGDIVDLEFTEAGNDTLTFTLDDGTSYTFVNSIFSADVSNAAEYIRSRTAKLRAQQEVDRIESTDNPSAGTGNAPDIELTAEDVAAKLETISDFSEDLSEVDTDELEQIIDDIDAESPEELLDSVQAELSEEPTSWGLLSESGLQRWPIKITENHTAGEIRNEIFRSIHTAEAGDGTAIIRWRVRDGRFTVVADYDLDESDRSMEISIGKQDHSGNGVRLDKSDFSAFAVTFEYSLREEPLDGTTGQVVEAVVEPTHSVPVQSVTESIEYLITESTLAELTAISEISVVDADALVEKAGEKESQEETYTEEREELEAISDELSTVESLLCKAQYGKAKSLQEDLNRRVALLKDGLDSTAQRRLRDSIDEVQQDIEQVLTKPHILGVLRSMDPYAFEQFVADIWAHNGWKATVTSGATDKGVDVVATKSDAFEDRQHLIQVKRYGPDSIVGSEAIQRYAGLYARRDEDIDGVFVVTSSGFSKEAESVAANRDVHLVDADALIDRLRET